MPRMHKKVPRTTLHKTPTLRRTHSYMYAHVYVCIVARYEFPDDNKQKILEPKLCNIFC